MAKQAAWRSLSVICGFIIRFMQWSVELSADIRFAFIDVLSV
jgi:hypothetical protein